MNVLFLIKPDDLTKQLEVLKRLQEMVNVDKTIYIQLDEGTVKTLYKEHVGKWFFQRNLNYLISSRVFVCKVEAKDIQEALDVKLLLRTEFGSETEIHKNSVHCSDSEEAATYELSLFF